MLKVVNKYLHEATEQDVYIGRGSPLGNPFTSIKNRQTKAKEVCESREESVKKFDQYIFHEIQNNNRIICDELNRIYLMAKKGDVNLVCFCKPKACHGDVIKKYIDFEL